MKKLILALLVLLATNVFAVTRLVWDAPLPYDSVTSHTLYFGVEGNLDRTQVIDMPVLEYEFEDSVFTENNHYCFHILSTNSIGNSNFGETTCKTIVVNVPAAPKNLTIE